MLKWIAAFAMLIDHIGYYFFDQMPPQIYEILRSLGRLAMPIFAFSLAFGFMKSKNWLKYFIRLFTGAIFSELVIRQIYQLIGYYRSGINILFTFSLSLVFLIALRILVSSGYDLLVRMQPIQSGCSLKEELPYQFRINLGFQLWPLLGLALGLIFMMVPVACILYYDTEYGLYGLLMVVAFYTVLNFDENKQAFWMYLLIIGVNLFFHILTLLNKTDVFNFNTLQWLTVLAVPLILRCKDDKKPSKWQKYFFYIFYPGHIALLGLLRYFLI